jgi:ribonuclease HI
MTIVAAADGSALGNPGPAGWAWYVDDDRWNAGGWPHGTNNQGELMAVLDLFNATAADADQELHILCDSRYVINTLTKWLPGWKRKGWRKADGSPVLNLDLMKQLDSALAGRQYAFEWVKGHAGHRLNEAADARARAAALAYQSGSPVPVGPGWTGGRMGALTPAASTTLRSAPAEPTSSASAAPPSAPVALFGIDEIAEDATDAQTVELLERRLLTPAVRADAAALAALLHPEFEEVGASGRLLDRETIIQSLDTPPAPAVAFELLSADAVGADAILLLYRSATSEGARVRSSLWLRSGGSWRIRFHQATPEAL